MWKRIKICLLTFCLVFVGAAAFSGCSYQAETEYEKYVKYTDVAYGDSARQKVDIAFPKGKTGEVGLILLIHGGGWRAGDKSGYEGSYDSWCGERGYVVAALNYRYASSNVHNEDILDDITLCLTKIKREGQARGVEIKKALLTGGSAGAHLSMQYAYTKANFAPIKPVAVASFAGPTDLLDENYYGDNPLVEEIIKMFTDLAGVRFTAENLEIATPFLMQASPINYVTPSSAPTLICQGAKDEVVPKSNAESLAKKLAEKGVRHDLIIYPNSGHGLESDPDCAALADELMAQYAAEYLS